MYGLNSLLLTWLYRRQKGIGSSGCEEGTAWLSRRRFSTELSLAGSVDLSSISYPKVTVQLPVYNERHVAERLIKAVVNLDWPAERLHIQILDDSTDDTEHIIRAAVNRHRARKTGIWLEHVRRASRQGFKAGALQYGLASASGDFIAVFDADFIPPPDFLQKTIPLFNEANVGCVQTRWGHVNPESSPLTKAQALGIDGHFVIEQTARHIVNAFLNFNGTAGIWRRACIIAAGGWQGDTLTEDLDLRYRAQLYGWRIMYQPDMIVPAELPVQLSAFKRQQFRWAKGSIQTALKLLGQLWHASQPLWLKLMGTLHLTNYSVHPLMLANLLLTLPMTMSDSPFLMLTPLFTFSAIGPPLLYWTAMQNRALSRRVRLGRLALLIALGTGLSLNNTKAVLEAVLGLDSEFKRTPKFAITSQFTEWQSSTYTLPRAPAAWLELVLALYSLGLLIWIISMGIWWLIPWLMLYAGGYSYVSGLAFVQAWQTKAARAGAVV
jgi:cellulose synthase/poly-beta-1,6-N-acetylglucosamine synthase-like glycosyltransferase